MKKIFILLILLFFFGCNHDICGCNQEKFENVNNNQDEEETGNYHISGGSTSQTENNYHVSGSESNNNNYHISGK